MKKINLIFFLLSVITVHTQSPANHGDIPGLISGASFVYHRPSQALLLVGGMKTIPDTLNSDVWKWDGTKWQRIRASGPGSIDFSQGIAASEDGHVLCFGGYDLFDDPKENMWSFDGKRWIHSGISNVGNRIHHAMIYADHLKAFVLYGGFDENRDNDTVTWLYKEGKFVAHKIPGPGPRHQFSMAYDKNRKKVVLYGGTERSAELWEYDGVKWEKIEFANGPGKRMRHQMIYDDDLKMVLLHGGDPRGIASQTTWGWNGTVWIKLAEANIYPIGLGYDEKRKVVVAYASSEDSLGIWELKDNAWIKVADFGAGWSSALIRKKWMEQYPDDVIPMIQAAFDYRFSRQYAEAESLYKKIERVFPSRISLLTNITYTLLMQNKFDDAKGYLFKIDKAGLKKRYQCNRLAGFLAQAKQYPEAIIYYEKATAIEPDKRDYFDLGRMHALAGDNDEAFVALDKAVGMGMDKREKYEADVSLAALRKDARWQNLLIKLK